MKKILLNFAAENTTNSHSIQQIAGVVAFLYTRSMTYYKQDKLLHPPSQERDIYFIHSIHSSWSVWLGAIEPSSRKTMAPFRVVRSTMISQYVICIYARIMVSNTISISGDILRVVLRQLQSGSSRVSCGSSWCSVFNFLCTALLNLMYFCP